MMRLLSLLVSICLTLPLLALDLNRLGSDASIQMLSDKFQVREGLRLSQHKISKTSAREIHTFTFDHPRAGKTQILLSGPIGFEKLKLPVLFVVAGFQTGMQSISFLQAPKDRILVGYEYPISTDALIAHPEQIVDSIPQSVGQTALLLAWLQQQPWVQQVDTLGVSLGTLILPAGIRLSETLGYQPKKSLFAFGGAEVGSMIRSYFRNRIPSPLLEPLAQALEVATLPLAPKIHLPFLHGSFLVIRGLKDEVFTTESGELLESLLPQPKKIVHLNTRHINTDQVDIIRQTVATIEEFLRLN